MRTGHAHPNTAADGQPVRSCCDPSPQKPLPAVTAARREMAESLWELQELEFGEVPRTTRVTVSIPTPKVTPGQAHNIVHDRLQVLLGGGSPVDAARIIDGDGNVVAETRRLLHAKVTANRLKPLQ